MKGFFKFLLFVGFVAGVVYALKKLLSQQETPQGAGAGVLPETPITPLEDASLGGDLSPRLLEILVDPEDKGSLELVDEGKFLLNPRTGYRYPIRNGIPVMLIEEGKKYQDTSRIAANGSSQTKATEAAG
ncbi:MAG: Trm112 family protein [Caldilineaceae bacterium]